MPTILEAMRRACLRRHYLSLLVLATALSACAMFASKNGQDRNYVYRSGDDYVRLEPVEPGAPLNSHPLAISPERLSRLLAGVKVSGAASVRAVPVFSKEELETIVPPLASALSKAGPNQDVTFAVTSYRGLFGTFSPESVTTGRLFISGNSLNLIFGLMQQRLDMGELDYTGVTPKITAGTRARRIDSTVWKIEPNGAHFHDHRGDWLVFDRSVIPAAVTNPATRPASEAGKKSGGETPAPPKIESKEQEIENRLRMLDDLRKKGVITEQEYRERRREILQEL